MPPEPQSEMKIGSGKARPQARKGKGRLGPRDREPERANRVARSIGDIQSPIAAFRHLAVQVSQYLARQRDRLAAGGAGVGELDTFGVWEAPTADDVEEEAGHRTIMPRRPKGCIHIGKPRQRGKLTRPRSPAL